MLISFLLENFGMIQISSLKHLIQLLKIPTESKQKFQNYQDSTLKNNRKATVDGKECVLNILDTSWQEEFPSINSDQHIRRGEGFLVLFSITDKDSFSNLKQILEKIKRIRDIDSLLYFPIILVANKIDLENQRRVSIEDARKFANENFIELIETSAKTRENVDQSFLNVANKIQTEKSKKIYFTGKGVEKLLGLEVETIDCEIPSINKGLKNVWMLIFKMVLTKNKKQRLNCKLVCKHWYDLISKNFEEKEIIFKTKIINLDYTIAVSSNPIPTTYDLKILYVYLADFCDYLNQSPEKVIQHISVKTRHNKNVTALVVLHNLENFKKQQENSSNFISNYFHSKKAISNIVHQFSSFDSIEVEDFSDKNKNKILKKIKNLFKKKDPKNFKNLPNFF